MTRLAFAVLLVAAGGCGPGSPPEIPDLDAGEVDAGLPDGITAVKVNGPASVPYLGRATLTASVEGRGSFVPVVTWAIQRGGGTLSATTGESVIYTAPMVSADTEVLVFATSTADSSKFGSVSLLVTKPPPPGVLLSGGYAGTVWEQRQKCTANGASLNPPEILDTKNSATTLTIAGADDFRATFAPVEGFPSGIPIALKADGTISFGSHYSELKSCGYPAGAQFQYIIRGGTGTWGYDGKIHLDWFEYVTGCNANVLTQRVFDGAVQ